MKNTNPEASQRFLFEPKNQSPFAEMKKSLARNGSASGQSKQSGISILGEGI